MSNPTSPTGSTNPYVSAFQQSPDEAFNLMQFCGVAQFRAAADAGRLDGLMKLARRDTTDPSAVIAEPKAFAAVVRGEWEAAELDSLLRGSDRSYYGFSLLESLVESVGRERASQVFRQRGLVQGLSPLALALYFGNGYSEHEVVLKTKKKVVRTYMGQSAKANRDAIALRLTFEQDALVGWEDNRADVSLSKPDLKYYGYAMRPGYAMLAFAFHALEMRWGEEYALSWVDSKAGTVKASLPVEVAEGPPSLGPLMSDSDSLRVHEKLQKRPWAAGPKNPANAGVLVVVGLLIAGMAAYLLLR